MMKTYNYHGPKETLTDYNDQIGMVGIIETNWGIYEARHWRERLNHIFGTTKTTLEIYNEVKDARKEWAEIENNMIKESGTLE